MSALTCQKMWSCRFAWQALHFVTFHVSEEECLCATVVTAKLPCQWEKSQKRVFLVSFSTCQKMWSCRFAWQAWHFVTFHVSEEECLRATVVATKLPCLWEKLPKCVFFDVSEDVVMSFCMARVALCDIPRV